MLLVGTVVLAFLWAATEWTGLVIRLNGANSDHIDAIAGTRRHMQSFAVASAIPDNLDTLLTRRSTAEALTAAGFPVRPATLATKATRGGGPPFRRFGRVPLYRWGDSLDWAKSRLSPPMRSTSEADA